ncbi:MAG: pilus assembly PilX N-terminal domain-containing protein [bacterium]
MKKRGSAIIIAMLLISAVTAVAFGFGRTLFMSISSAALYENGKIAYYSAESGIEEAFLRYRLDKNTEVPFVASNDAFSVVGSTVLRNDITNGEVIDYNNGKGVNKNTLSDYSASHQVYDLRIDPKTSAIGPTGSDSNPVTALEKYNASDDKGQNNIILRDESQKFDGTNIFAHSDFNLTFKPLETKDNIKLAAPFNDKNCLLIEAKIVGKTMAGTNDEKKMFFYSNSPSCDYTKVFQANDLNGKGVLGYGLSGNKIAQIQNLKSLIWPTVILSQAELYLKPIGADMAFALTRKNPISDELMYGSTTKIESTGYYGSATRKLEVTLDRQSGSLYDLFDYVIYKTN